MNSDLDGRFLRYDGGGGPQFHIYPSDAPGGNTYYTVVAFSFKTMKLFVARQVFFADSLIPRDYSMSFGASELSGDSFVKLCFEATVEEV